MSNRITTNPNFFRRTVITVVTVAVLAATGALSASAASKASAQVTFSQTGSALTVRWAYKNATPAKQKLVVYAGTKVVSSVTPAKAERTRKLDGLAAGNYRLILTSTSPAVSAQRDVVVVGKPQPVSDLAAKVSGNKLSVTWKLPAASRFSTAEHVVVKLTGGATPKQISLAPTVTSADFDGISATSDYTITLRLDNVAGSSTESSLMVKGDNGSALTTPRLVDLTDAGAVFDSFAMVQRAPRGPVDLDNPVVADENKVMAALHRCVLTGPTGSIGSAVMADIGGVWGTRNAAGTMILTSGAVAVTGQDMAAWVGSNSVLRGCVTAPLTAQISAIATQLSAVAKVSGITVSNLDVSRLGGAAVALRVEAKVLPNGGTTNEVEQDIQLVWVAVGNGSTVSQYIVARQGNPLEAGLVDRLVTAVANRNAA